MVALFEMIVAGFLRFFSFFSKYVAITNTRTILDMFRLLSRKAMLAVLIALIVSYTVIAFAFFYYMIDVIISVYNMISHFIIMIQSPASVGGGASSPMLQGAMMLINASGIVQGIQSAFPFIASALLFRLMKVLYQLVERLHFHMITIFNNVILLATSA